jgi:hypothetical protein
MGRTPRLIVAGCVIASLLGACGSDGSAKPDPNKILTKSQYIERADAICKSYGERIRGVYNSAGGGLNFVQSKKILSDKLIPLFRAELLDLIALKPPKADKVRLNDKFLLNLSQGINTVIARVGAAKTMRDLDAINPPGLQRAKQAALAYGIKQC